MGNISRCHVQVFQMKLTKVKQGLVEISKKWVSFYVLFFHYILEQVSKGCHNQQAQQQPQLSSQGRGLFHVQIGLGAFCSALFLAFGVWRDLGAGPFQGFLIILQSHTFNVLVIACLFQMQDKACLELGRIESNGWFFFRVFCLAPAWSRQYKTSFCFKLSLSSLSGKYIITPAITQDPI